MKYISILTSCISPYDGGKNPTFYEVIFTFMHISVRWGGGGGGGCGGGGGNPTFYEVMR